MVRQLTTFRLQRSGQRGCSGHLWPPRQKLSGKSTLASWRTKSALFCSRQINNSCLSTDGYDVINGKGYSEMGTIPNSYQAAEWRNTTPADCNTRRIGVGFDMSDGTVFRITLSRESARHLAETLNIHLTRSQSSISSGMPSVDVSYPPGGVKV